MLLMGSGILGECVTEFGCCVCVNIAVSDSALHCYYQIKCKIGTQTIQMSCPKFERHVSQKTRESNQKRTSPPSNTHRPTQQNQTSQHKNLDSIYKNLVHGVRKVGALADDHQKQVLILRQVLQNLQVHKHKLQHKTLSDFWKPIAYKMIKPYEHMPERQYIEVRFNQFFNRVEKLFQDEWHRINSEKRMIEFESNVANQTEIVTHWTNEL